jgi:hypothetical protein
MTRVSSRLRSGAGPVVALLAARNVAEVVLPHVAYVPTNLVAGAAVLALGRRAGCTWDDLGLDPRRLREAFRIGAMVGSLVVAGMGLGAAWPTTRGLFDDSRVPADAR